LNSQDDPRIVYYSTGVGFRTAVFNSAWVASTVDSGALVGAGAGMAFQRFGYFLSAYFDGTAGSLKVATDLPRNLTMSGTILDNNNQPIPGATLQLTGTIKSQSVPVNSGTGSFSVGNLMVGNYTLTPSADGYKFDHSSRSISPLSSSVSGLAFMGVATGIQTEHTVFDPTKGVKVKFSYSVLEGHVSLRIRTLRGAPVRTVVDEDKSAWALTPRSGTAKTNPAGSWPAVFIWFFLIPTNLRALKKWWWSNDESNCFVARHPGESRDPGCKTDFKIRL
jgi:hypothetical protein